jgi:hypothetical protein
MQESVLCMISLVVVVVVVVESRQATDKQVVITRVFTVTWKVSSS